MKLVIVSGSHRQHSESRKVSEYIADRAKALHYQDSVHLVDLAVESLPMWDESIWQGDQEWQARLAPLHQQLNEASAFVIVSPEWSGMVPAALKNFFLLCGARELGHKPALITAVSAGIGGSYPVNELRMSSYKNTRLCYLPEHLIIRNVKQVLNAPSVPIESNSQLSAEDQYIRERIDFSVSLLHGYDVALKQVRAANLTDYEKYPNGM
ncbi:NADPH azoreductase [Piscirickettsia salmonis]|uniref:Flavoprotein n=1 Tax=Piscirickettsia salmonis TaxID=1238 RepID=A0A1L6TCL8_PISSA|nr:NAD(P)H-dependent oxidoreductase [Piscirickettsia salmonis]AKP74181.2 flavoprotein [Piscirickettsia salmonis LF-89 = ATCC VR-1361]ALB23064.1 flavoprotein [Piscirickettsia salmonis]ALY03000.1 flavoprotein [Piscirickettsia salmonis]AMA42558.1 flavoprotein [Piscirickettsia salmonis]AOS35028.1 flavoprotein [Piscirickettsia salmonis]